jgi:hypothetical protein
MRVHELGLMVLVVPASAVAAKVPNGSGGWFLSREPGGDDTDNLSAALNDTAPAGPCR